MTTQSMASLRISMFPAWPKSATVLRYGAAVALVAMALGTALILRHDNLPHPFTSFSFAAIASTFWCAGTGPGLLALLLSYLALSDLFVPVKVLGSSSESYLVIYGIFGAAVSWFSALRRRTERLLTEARDHLEMRVAERTSELTQANQELQKIHAELRHEKDRLALLLDLNNSIVSNLELRDLLRDISASVRRLMQCDSVGVNSRLRSFIWVRGGLEAFRTPKSRFTKMRPWAIWMRMISATTCIPSTVFATSQTSIATDVVPGSATR